MTKSAVGWSVLLLLAWLPLGPAAASAESGPLGPLPATFAGDLPCADCPGTVYQLDLFDDQVFYLRISYLDRGDDAFFDDLGSWSTDPEGTVLALWGTGDTPTRFRIVDSETLRLLDREGEDIESSLNYNLMRSAEFSAIEPQLSMRGMYMYMADAALFTDCLTGRRLPVAMEADNLALERAYLEAQRRPGDELLIGFEGRIALRPPMEGDGVHPTVIVEKFTGLWPGETCGARMSVSELLGTRWRLTRLGEEPVILTENQRAPFFTLQSEGNRVSGFGGCNTFNGSFESEGEEISFGRLATTMMACIEGEDTERAFLGALDKTVNFRHIRHHLELLDENGELLLRLEAQHLD